ncbi:hypothetical protein BW733_06530 [Tessaracoccus flavescens]|uniref:Uncharacterized protein n=1 Tax=Tessaracoccus flavescens TaxID=399497 RepID=A0A1Q2CWP2_9ACTN|nr:hypothetical protein BW733_06530 [Tessaracoccus flavescens]
MVPTAPVADGELSVALGVGLGLSSVGSVSVAEGLGAWEEGVDSTDWADVGVVGVGVAGAVLWLQAVRPTARVAAVAVRAKVLNVMFMPTTTPPATGPVDKVAGIFSGGLWAIRRRIAQGRPTSV